MADAFQKILYVEDEPDIQLIARLALETVGQFTVKICGSGQEAVLEAPGFGPQLILLDVMMPSMDGPSTLAELRKIESLRDVPVVFMTAKVQPQEVAQLRQIGAIDVIPKPFDPIKLSTQVRAIWAAHQKA